MQGKELLTTEQQKRQRKKTTLDDRVVAAALAALTSQHAAAQATDIPQTSLSYWVAKVGNDSELAAYVQQKETELQIGLRHVAGTLMTRLEQLAVNPEAKGIKDTAIALGILMDKMAPSEPRTVTQAPSDRPNLIDMMQSPTDVSTDTQS